ncbi:toxin-activating lysine-acyltransferase [Rickettsiales bacterium]|nr:toxin-activating lysine-acyltransferase [Rickettsiales bacterium]
MMNNPKISQKSSKKLIFSKESGILPKIPNQEKYNLIGQIASLMLASKVHKKYLIDDIGAMFLPAIHLNQFRIYKNNNGDPIGIITWAFLSDKNQENYQKGLRSLKLEDWKSGDNGWIMDFIAPFGHAKQIIKDLRTNIFPERQGKALRITKDGKIKGVLKLHGKNFKK